MGWQAFLRTFPLFNFREGEIPQLEALSQVLRCAPPCRLCWLHVAPGPLHRVTTGQKVVCSISINTASCGSARLVRTCVLPEGLGCGACWRCTGSRCMTCSLRMRESAREYSRLDL